MIYSVTLRDRYFGGSNGKLGLLYWCKSLIPPEKLKLENFTNNWDDGKAFIYLLNSKDSLNVQELESVGNLIERKKKIE